MSRALALELLTGLGAASLALVAITRPWDSTAELDLFSVVGVGIALCALVVLLLRQRGALGHAHRKAANEATRARHDFLTGLPNRLAADAALESLLERGAGLMDGSLARAQGERGVVPFWHGAAYLAIDLDEFKPVNDDCGHAEGDRLLCEIADILRTSVGAGDVVARVGGDEFSVLMTERDAEEARALACRVRDALRAHHFAAGGRRYPVSGSMGLVRIAPTDREPDDIREAADAAAYAAKEAGRDAVFEVVTRGADPVRLDHADDGAVGGGEEATLLAHRMASIGASAHDRIELRLDPAGEPPTVGRAFKHLVVLGCAATTIDPDVHVSIVCPPVVGERDLATLERMARRIADRRRDTTTVFLEPPRRRGEHEEMLHVVAMLRTCGLRVGIVCRTHSLSGLAFLARMAPDELELHLARAPTGTLDAYAMLADGGRWQLSVADVADAETLSALAGAPIEFVGGAVFGEGGSPSSVLATLRDPGARGGPSFPPPARARAA